MDVPKTEREIDDYLFGDGLTVDDYFIDEELIGYKSNGREFHLLIDHEGLATACRVRLVELGVRRLP